MYRLIRYIHPRTVRPLPALAVRQPWAGLGSEIDHLFATALADFAAPAQTPGLPVHLTEDQDNLYVRAELPGVSREAIKLEIADGRLTLTATPRPGEESFERVRSLELPETVQADKASAKLELGVLTVTLPKQEQAKPRQIAVN